MRVIGGEYRGRSLKPVPGSSTRPTTDRVREAWASSVNSLASEGFSDLRVLDAFAGSGALGIEALSRGAAFCTFVDADCQAQSTIRGNLASLQLDVLGKSQIIAKDVFSPSAQKSLTTKDPYGLVLLDPPYDMEQTRVLRLLLDLSRCGALRTETIISYEQRSQVPDQLGGQALDGACSPLSLKMVSCKVYGATQIRYYRCC